MKHTYIYFLLALCLVGCHTGRKYFPPKQEMESKHVEIIRFDSALLSVQSADIEQDIRHLYAQYHYFMPVFVEDILGILTSDTAYLAVALTQ